MVDSTSNSPKFNEQKRKLQVLARGRGYCPVCQKETNLDIVYVYEKRKIRYVIPLIVVNFYGTRRWPDFYGVVCDECRTVITVMRNKKELRNKYRWSAIRRRHMLALKKPEVMTIRFLS